MKLPEGWVETTIGNIIDDMQPGFSQKPGKEDGDTTPQIRTHNISPDGKLTLEGIKHVTASNKESERYSLTKGDVVFNNTNSEEWVGKTAVFDQEGEFVFSNHITRLRANSKLITPDFLAAYLQFLWSMGFSKTRAKRWVSQAGIEGSTLALFRIPLPSLPEQERIVDVLQQVGIVAKAKQSIDDHIDNLVRTAYWEHFSEWYTADGLRDPVRISDIVADSQYGVSEAMSETGKQAILRMNSITTSGWLNLADLKYATLSEKDIKATTLLNGDLLFNRTNSKELVGKCAIWRGAKEPFSYASYIVRFRMKEGILPEYIWATLNSSYGKYRLMNSAKQAVSMANVSPTDLGRITVPLPPLALQEKFAKLINHIETLRQEMLNKQDQYSELQTLVTQQALLGEHTAQWRDENREKVLEAAKARDILLREQGVKITKFALEKKHPKKLVKERERPARQWVVDELSEFQRQVLGAFLAYHDQPLLAEDAEVFARFCEDDEVLEHLSAFGSALNNRIRRTLSQLASLGLIAKVTLPKDNLETGEREYLKAFRPLREEEFRRLEDVSELRKLLAVNEASYYFTVMQDFESSEHAGAGGMFQVISIIDDSEKDVSYLIDSGKHYESLCELAVDIAVHLGVRTEQIELETD
ncbi:restriction modification system DNA specificity domain protein [Shewanella baltica OS223]|uniref:restriction endonuclease subunit S n=1 Tax=Shewanella baltica TaxID=62322 RepID=UPI00015310AE|nr:restriction endonuclease subunit S [Shewanella baltica]ACK44924.1 restriction modification system DNA specificity domain protein [Shewanella baltica OS223]